MKTVRLNRIAVPVFAVFCLLCFFFTGKSKDALTASKSPVSAKNGMVVSTQRIASQVGVDILKQGGNAVDAAVAVSYALAVVHPSAGNIGGGGFMVIRWQNGEAITVDYREKAPGKGNSDMYLDENREVIAGLSRLGAFSTGVPGTVAGTLLALEKYGTMSVKEVLAPAIELAENGFPITTGLARSLNSSRLHERFSKFDGTRKIFMKPSDKQWEAGEILRQTDLANTFELIVRYGKDGFYKGKVADDIVKTMRKYDGIITHEDLANYEAIIRPPVVGTYRDYEIISMGPSSSGGIALIQLLNLLERYDLESMGWNSSETIHLITESERRVYADRAEYLGDPDFVDIPVKHLLKKLYADRRAEEIDRFHATPSRLVSHGEPDVIPFESEETTHYSVVDRSGIAVSVTTTLNGGYGSCVVAEGSGFLLNNEMDDFSVKPGHPNMYGLIGSEANSIQPNKRMLSSMTPTIVTKDGKTYMIIGTPGGSTIITTVFQVIMNVIDHGMNIQEAVSASRFHHQWFPDVIQYERFAFSKDTIDILEAMGHKLRIRRSIGDSHGILIDPKTGIYYGGADPRMEGVAIGY